MRKDTKIILSIFVAGILLGGIGVGVAVSEIGNLTYSGVHFLGEDQMVTEIFDEKIVVDDSNKILIRPEFGNGIEEFEIIYKEGIPKDVIRYEVTYIKNNVEIETYLHKNVYIETKNYDESILDENEQVNEEMDYENDNEEEVTISAVGLSLYYYGNNFNELMETKDMVLQELKQNKIGSYTVENIKSIKVYASPEIEPYIIRGETY